GACSQHSASFHHVAFVHAHISPDHHIILDDHWKCTHRLQHSSDLCCCGKMAILPNLRARTDQRVRIDHRAFAHIRPDVHKHRRHADHSPADICAIPYAGSSGNNTHAIRNRNATH